MYIIKDNIVERYNFIQYLNSIYTLKTNNEVEY